MRHNDDVVVAGGDSGHRLGAPAGRHTFAVHQQQANTRVQAIGFGGVLHDAVVRNDVHDLVAQTKAAYLHAQGDGDKRLTVAHIVPDQHVDAL